MHYPVLTTGLVTAPRGIVGAMIAMFVVARMIDRVDNRLMILFGLLLTAVSMWQMTRFSLCMGMEPVILSGLLQGFGLGCAFVPLNTIALSNLPRSILTQGTALRSLMRNLGGSVGISILEARLTQDIQINHSRIVEQLRPDNHTGAGAAPRRTVQPDRPRRHRRAQRRGDPSGVDGRVSQRFRPDDDHNHRLLPAVVARASPAAQRSTAPAIAIRAATVRPGPAD